jgi:hypothetical protein
MDGELRAIFQKHLPLAHWQAIESALTGPGIPDAEYCFPGGVSGWLEFKRTRPGSPWTVDIRKEQVAWAERRLRKGGRIHLAVRQKHAPNRLRGALDALFLYRGADLRAVFQNGLKTPPLGLWHGGPARWDWAAIARELTRKA